MRDPYTALVAMRRLAPRAPHRPVQPPREENRHFESPDEIWTVLTYEGMFRVLRDGKRFSSARYQRTIGARPQQPHPAFSIGPHVCLGMPLAGMETRVLLETLFEQCPHLRVDPTADDVHVSGMIFRAPLTLPVLFDAAVTQERGR